MVFYPDNVPRAGRLQQLVDSMDNMQTDIKHYGEQMDAKNTAIKPGINALLKERDIDNIDDLIEKSMKQMTPEDKEKFEALIKAAKASNAGFDYAYFTAGLLMLPEGAILTGKVVTAIGRFVCRLQVVQALAKFFRVAGEGAGAAGAAAELATELEKAAIQAESAAKEAGLAGEAGTEVAEASKLMGRVSKFFKVLGVVGFVVTIVVGIIEAIEGEEQKTKLIEAIQGSQSSRLCIAYFKREASNIMQQLELIATWIECSVGEDKDDSVAAVLSKKIVRNISSENSKIDWTKLEDELEIQDKSSGNYYGGADLSRDEVVKRAIEDHNK